MKIQALSFLFYLAPLSLAAQSPLIINVPNRSTQSLDGQWHYIIDPYENGFYDYRREPFEERENPGSGAYFTNARPQSKGERIEYSFEKSPTLWAPGSWNTQADEETVWSEEYQAHLYEQTLKGINNIPGLSGFSPWILADFRSPRRPLPIVQGMWNRKGLISEGGHKKMAFQVLQRYYEKLKSKE